MSGTAPTPQQTINTLMALYGGTPWTPPNPPINAGYYYQLSNPTRIFCIPPVPTTTPATDPTAWATQCIAAAALTQVS